jgi:hypothetical protein
VEVGYRKVAVGEQVEHEPVDERANRLHEVGRQRVAIVLVGVEDAKARVEADDPRGDRRLGLEQRIEVVEERVRRVRRDARRAGERGGPSTP